MIPTPYSLRPVKYNILKDPKLINSSLYMLNQLQDTDVLWLRDPFAILTLNETVDLQISVDQFNGKQWSQKNPINTGFYMVRSNNKTIALFDEWYGQRNNSTGKKEQDVLIELMRKGAFNRLRLRVRFLDTNYFSGFCRDSRDANVVSTVHANCCKSIRAKVIDLVTVIHDWKRFKDPSRNKTIEYRWSNHSACKNSWIS
ncbi:putative nucleotide-diphospho-sugar transferase [Helianthus debilis subsp. tardiflorus]